MATITITITTALATTTPTAMAESERLLRLFTWLSPAFPVGGFAYSQGLETAIATGRIGDGAALAGWIEGQLHLGNLRTDAYFLAIAARAIGNDDAAAFHAVSELALALQVSAERWGETVEQSRSFLEAAAHWPLAVPHWLETALGGPLALPLAFGAMAGAHGVETRAAVLGYVNAAVGQQVSVGVRLIPLGQTRGLAIQAALEAPIAALADDALAADIDDIAAMGYGTDIASLRHEDLGVRIFRS